MATQPITSNSQTIQNEIINYIQSNGAAFDKNKNGIVEISELLVSKSQIKSTWPGIDPNIFNNVFANIGSITYSAPQVQTPDKTVNKVDAGTLDMKF